jgi:hypothetical protein
MTIRSDDASGLNSWSATAVTSDTPRPEWLLAGEEQTIEFITADAIYRTTARVRAEEFGIAGYTSLVFTPLGGLDDE